MVNKKDRGTALNLKPSNKSLFQTSKTVENGNWYKDRYQSMIIQRNLMLLISIISMIGLIISSIIAVYINKSNTLKPFVVEIEKKTGITTVVEQDKIKKYSADETIAKHFLITYLRSRELFDKNNYEYNWYTVVRLLSNDQVYSEFRRFVHPSNIDSPINIYSSVGQLDIKIRSIQFLTNNSVQIRFSINSSSGSENNSDNKVALISFEYLSMKLDENQRYINPLGFRVTSYRVTNEFLQ